jgi:SAM-dependent methyltransferase
MPTLRTTSCSGAGLERSELYAADHHWGDAPVDLSDRDLPALKARYLVSALPTRGKVLEIGCGGGRILNTIASNRPELDLYGCDIRPIAHPSERFQFALVEPARSDLPYDAGTFDAVVMFDVLEHVLDPPAMVSAARSVMRRGGVVVSFTPLEDQRLSFYRMYRRLFGDALYVDTKEHLQAFSEVTLLRLFEADFVVADVEYAYHFFGHLMDATLFALTKVPSLRKRFWESNPYYRESGSADADTVSGLATMMRVANAVAYAESRWLRHRGLGAAGMLFTATAR